MRKGYVIKLTERMVVALIDIDTGYDEEDSPSVDQRTVGALRRRGYVHVLGRRLTKSGRAALGLALAERFEGTAKSRRKVA